MTGIPRRDFLTASTAGVVQLAWGGLSRAESPQEETGQANPFLSENFAPVREEIAVDNLKVIGRIPRELNGMFVRNGPNPQFPPKLNYHWFDGDGMLHGVRIRDGRASYRNRWVRTAAWHEANEAGRSVYPSVLDPPDAKLFLDRLLQGQLPYPNTANTALLWHHGRLLALWEGGAPHEIRVPDLETIGPYGFGAKLSHAFTAHPKVDPKTGELMFFGYSPISPTLQYSVADRDGTIKSTTPIHLPRAVMIHDLAITENYSLFIDCPMVIDPAAMLRGQPILGYRPEHGAHIGILPRHAAGTEIRWFEIETCFIFHIFNACEEGDAVVLHGCRFAEYPEFVSFDGPRTDDQLEAENNALPVAWRWTFDLKSGATTESVLDDIDCEFPRVNEQQTGSRTRYGYAVSGESRGFLKYDFDRDTRQQHRLDRENGAGEGVFVPKPDARTEDDGWLIGFTHNRAEIQSELRIIDTRSFTDPPVARIRMPRRVPYGFHGVWLPDV